MPEMNLPVKYEELTGPEFIKAVELSESVCVIPMGILEKHGPHLPLGTDLLDAREVALRAAAREYSLVFPEYYFGQIHEARHQPGTIAYSHDLAWKLLDETCEELARNGLKKIILVNGHGGNRFFLHYFCQVQMARPKDYAVVLFRSGKDAEAEEKLKKLRKTKADDHAGEVETSMIMAHRPDLAHVERGTDQSGENLDRLKHLPYAFPGIWWYAKYPNHYAGDGSQASSEIGDIVLDSEANQPVELIKALKKDDTLLTLQKEFFERSKNPLETGQ
jgi:creatinine amidohydrolase